jgi:hypothetical protein
MINLHKKSLGLRYPQAVAVKNSQAVRHLTRHLDPVVRKHRLHLGHYWPLHLEMGVPPMVWILRAARPLRCNAHAASEGYSAIHHQQLAVGAVVHAAQVEPLWWVKFAYLYTGRRQLINKCFITMGLLSLMTSGIFLLGDKHADCAAGLCRGVKPHAQWRTVRAQPEHGGRVRLGRHLRTGS